MESPSSTSSSPRPEAEPTEETQVQPEESTESSFFPSPPSFYLRYTTASLALPLNDETQLSLPATPTNPEDLFSRSDLEPPKVDWVLERGFYEVFGERWPIVELLPSLTEMGVQELFDRNVDRQTSLQNLLKALLLTWKSLLNSLLASPPSKVLNPIMPDDTPTHSDKLVQHIRLITINMHHLVNELRPVQARETLKSLMREQIDSRKAKTLAIRQPEFVTNLICRKCEELKTKLEKVQSNLETASTITEEVVVEVRPLTQEEMEVRDRQLVLAAVDALGF